MVSVMAAMLDELMGRDRNLAPDDKSRGIRWNDKRVCKFYLCGMCPHELFTNTKADLGSCDKIHDEELKAEFNKVPFYDKTEVYDDYERMIESHIREVDKRINRGHQRLKLSKEQNGESAVASFLFGGPNDEKVKMLTEKINELVDQAEARGCEGKVEEAQGITRLCDQLKDERFQLANQGSRIPSMIDTALREEKMMEVCEICGAFLIVGDAQSRIDDHLMGKQHMGYAKLRNCLADLHETRRKAREERDKAKADAEAERSKRREEREKEREKDREKDRERDDRRRRRDSDGRKDGGRRRSKSRERRDRGKERRRSRSRDRKRDRDEKRKSSRSRSRSRDRRKDDRRERSRSRDRGSRRDRNENRDKDKRRDKDADSKREKSEGKEERPGSGSGKDEANADAKDAGPSGSSPSAEPERLEASASSSSIRAQSAGGFSLLQRLRNGEGYPEDKKD